MFKGKTKGGFAYQISDERMNNYELVEAINELEDNPLGITRVVGMLLGRNQANRLKDSLRTDDGIVPVDKMTAAIQEIFEAQQVKKS